MPEVSRGDGADGNAASPEDLRPVTTREWFRILRAQSWAEPGYASEVYQLACLIERSHNIRPEFAGEPYSQTPLLVNYTQQAVDEWALAPLLAKTLCDTLIKRASGWKSRRDQVLERISKDTLK